MNTKAFIITRDRVSYAQKCYLALTQQSLLDVYIIDHGSTYPPMLRWLKSLPKEHVIYGGDVPPRHVWSEESREVLVKIIGDNQPFIVTDCDVVPAVPIDVFRWRTLLNQHPDRVKVGSTLLIDDLKSSYPYLTSVLQWETAFWQNEIERHVYSAPIDTTLAMYRCLEEFKLAPALRDGHTPARHLTWYETAEDFQSAEIMWYRMHARTGSSHWNSEHPWG